MIQGSYKVIQGLYVRCKRLYPNIANQTDKNMETEIIAGFIQGIMAGDYP